MATSYLSKSYICQISDAPIVGPVVTIFEMAEMTINLSNITGIFASRSLQCAKPPEKLLQEVVAATG